MSWRQDWQYYMDNRPSADQCPFEGYKHNSFRTWSGSRAVLIPKASDGKPFKHVVLSHLTLNSVVNVTGMFTLSCPTMSSYTQRKERTTSTSSALRLSMRGLVSEAEKPSGSQRSLQTEQLIPSTGAKLVGALDGGTACWKASKLIDQGAGTKWHTPSHLSFFTGSHWLFREDSKIGAVCVLQVENTEGDVVIALPLLSHPSAPESIRWDFILLQHGDSM